MQNAGLRETGCCDCYSYKWREATGNNLSKNGPGHFYFYMVQKALEKYKELRPSQTMKNQAGEHVILVMRAGSDEIVDCGGEGLYLLLLSHPHLYICLRPT